MTRFLYDQLRWFRHAAGQGVNILPASAGKQKVEDDSPIAPFKPSRTYFRQYLGQPAQHGGYLCFSPRLCVDRSNRQELDRQNAWLTSRLLVSATELFPEHRPTERDVKSFVGSLVSQGQTVDSYVAIPSRHTYQPLVDPAGQVRLPRLLPLGNREDGAERVTCEIHCFALNETPHYVALSYTWGEPIFDRTVIIDGSEHAVTSNLLLAMVRLRQKGHEYIWIDALSIDQTNLSEKSKQIPLMLKIYQRAEMVAIYLGEETGDTDEIEQLGPFIAKIANSQSLWQLTKSLHEQGEGLYTMGAEADTLLRQHGFPPRTNKMWISLYKLLQRPWFRRVWIQQEAAANENTEVLMRGMSIEWGAIPRVYGMLTVLLGSMYHLPMDLDKALPDDPAHAEAHQADLSQEYALRLVGFIDQAKDRLKTGGTPLHELLHRSRMGLATNPRDKIYSVLGLSDCADRAPLPDYPQSVERVYTEYAHFLVREGQGISVLAAAGRHRQRMGSLHSWVPDWTFEEEVISFHAGNRGYWTSPFSSSGDSEACIQLAPEDESVLDVEGGIIDSIHAISPPIRSAGWEPWTRDFLLWDEACLDLLRNHSSMLNSSESEIMRAYCDTLVAGAALYGRPYDNVQEHEAMINTLRKPYWQLRFDDLDTSHDSDGAQTDTKSRRTTAGRNYGLLLADFTNCRRICLTKSGKIGLVPALAVEGDVVCIIFGAVCPLILRCSGDEHTLIGDAYINGVMYDGVAMEENDFVPQQFRLC